MNFIDIPLDYFRLNKRLFYPDSPTTVKVREMDRLIGYFEDEDKRINTVLKSFSKKIVSYYQCISYQIFMIDIKIYDKTLELQMKE